MLVQEKYREEMPVTETSISCNNNNNNNNNTDREVTGNRPDIIIKNNKAKTPTLINVAIPADRNVM